MKRAAWLLLSVLFLLHAGCKADLSAYADTPITVTGLTDEPFTVTPAELAQLKCVDAKARGNSDKAGTVRAPNWSYDSLSNATSDKLTIFVGYYGMSYTQKLVLPVRDIINNCAMVQQTFSYITRAGGLFWKHACGTGNHCPAAVVQKCF